MFVYIFISIRIETRIFFLNNIKLFFNRSYT